MSTKTPSQETILLTSASTWKRQLMTMIACIDIQDTDSNIIDATCANVDVTPQLFTFREKHSISQFACGLSLSVSDDIIKSNNKCLNTVLSRNNVPRSHVKYDVLSTKATLSTIRQKVSNLSALGTHQTCDNRCYLFDPVVDRNTSNCPVSGSSGRTYVKICSLVRKIAYLLCSEDKRVALRYRHDNFVTPKADDYTSYDDIFDGEIYQECLKKGLFEFPDTLALASNVDGFSSKCSKKSFVTVHVIILNYSPVERSRGDNVFEVAVFCGNHKKDLRSLLRPIIKELETFGRIPLKVYKNNTFVTKANIHCLTLTGDLVEINSLMDFAGFTSLYGCKQCLTLGEHPVDSCESCAKTGLYFPQRDQAERTRNHLLLLEKDESINQKNYGINKVNMCKDVPVFDVAGAFFHGLDEMHLLSNIAKLVYGMIAPTLNKSFKYAGNEGAYPFRISKSNCLAVEKSLGLTKNNIPDVFLGSWQPFNPNSQLSKYRSVDYIDILRYIIPALIAPRLENLAAGKALCCLCRGVALAMQRCVSAAEINEIESNFKKWFDFLDQCVDNESISLTVFRVNMHLLSHIGSIIRKLGPMTAYSARSMERSIGALKKKMKASNRAGTNACNLIEIDQLIDFLDVHKLLDLDVDLEVKDNSDGGLNPNDLDCSYLCSPFGKTEYSFAGSNSDANVEGVVKFRVLARAIIHMVSGQQGKTTPNWDSIQKNHKMKIAGKIAVDNSTYASEMSRSRNKNVQKEGCYAIFEYNKRIFRGQVVSRIDTVWFVGKLLFFSTSQCVMTAAGLFVIMHCWKSLYLRH